MKVVKYNKAIFDVLISCGFRYCYSKTVSDPNRAGMVNIYLTPVESNPILRKLPLRYDAHHQMAEEPCQMASIIDSGTTIYIDLHGTLLNDCWTEFADP